MELDTLPWQSQQPNQVDVGDTATPTEGKVSGQWSTGWGSESGQLLGSKLRMTDQKPHFFSQPSISLAPALDQCLPPTAQGTLPGHSSYTPGLLGNSRKPPPSPSIAVVWQQGASKEWYTLLPLLFSPDTEEKAEAFPPLSPPPIPTLSFVSDPELSSGCSPW